jgi:hypothetical protein
MRFGQDFLGVGIGLRREHYDSLWDHTADIDFVEVLTENAIRESLSDEDTPAFVRFGGRTREALDRASRSMPIVLHGVSLSIGGIDPLDPAFLDATDILGDELQARWFSDHLCWSSAHSVELHDLLPLPFTTEAVDHVVRRVREVARRSKRPLLLENPTYYCDVSGHRREMDEATFIRRIADQSDCGLLLDVNNVYVNAVNHGYDARRFLDALPLERVAQIHLAGHITTELDHDGRTEQVLIDTHSRPVDASVLDLYAHVLERTGPVSTLLEWDHDIPDIDRMVAELASIRATLERVTGCSRPT